MGLDWIALDETNVSCAAFRGKGVAHDPNIKEDWELSNACYGGEDEMMTSEQQKKVIAGIEALLAKPESEIKCWDDETYDVLPPTANGVDANKPIRRSPQTGK